MPLTIIHEGEEHVGYADVAFSAQSTVTVTGNVSGNRFDIAPIAWLSGLAGPAAKRWAAPFVTVIAGQISVVISLANAADTFTGTVRLNVKWWGQ